MKKKLKIVILKVNCIKILHLFHNKRKRQIYNWKKERKYTFHKDYLDNPYLVRLPRFLKFKLIFTIIIDINLHWKIVFFQDTEWMFVKQNFILNFALYIIFRESNTRNYIKTPYVFCSMVMHYRKVIFAIIDNGSLRGNGPLPIFCPRYKGKSIIFA